MTKPLRLSLPLLSAALVALTSPTALGWTPRLSTSCRGVRISPDRRRVLLSANANDDLDADSDEPSDREHEADSLPLFAEGDSMNSYISRLEAMMGSGFVTEDLDTKNGEENRRLLEEGERVVLGDWMEWDEGPCYGDKCGEEEQCDIPDEYKVAHPKVDVMSFLGIKRAEPLHVQRDWD